MKKLFVVDATGFIFRSYYAIRGMTNAKGEPTNALFGFIRSLLKLIKDFSPSHLCAVFDAPDNKSSRVAIYKDYKANRVAIPEDLPHQIEAAKTFCKLFGIPTLIMPGVESDDTMGSIAKWAQEHVEDIYLCTSDKDLLQMVNDRVHVLHCHKDNFVIGPEEVKEKYGISPHQIVDWLALVGDSSDNVPGLPGFGPKTASTLLQKMETLDYILAHPEEVPGKKKQETIIENREVAELSKRLVQLDLSIPIPRECADYHLQQADSERLQAFYEEQGFKSLIEDKKEDDKGKESTTYILINDEESLKELAQKLSLEKEVCFDTETTGLRPMEADLVGIGFAIEKEKAYYVPFNATLSSDTIWSYLSPLFTNPSIGFYAHNAKYDLHVLKRAGIHVANLCFDTLLASYLLNAESHQHSLDFLSLHHFGKQKTPIESLIGKGKKQISMADVPIQQVCDYCCEDVDYTLRLKEVLKKALESRQLEHLLYDLELPLSAILLEMEQKGIFADAHMLQDFSREITQALQVLEKSIHSLAGEPFNIKSPKQLSVILFEKMEIPPPKKTATGYSTSADVLEGLKGTYPIAEKVLEFRGLEKLRSTYADTLPTEIHPETGRIHCTFNQGVTATGRLSSQNPNLQNIPVRTALGRKIRESFRPQKEGWSYLSADYSQIELRLVAHMSEDPEMIRAFEMGEDIHSFTASQVFGVPLEEVTKEQRYRAKTVNFGIVYGQQAYGLSQEIGVSISEAKKFIETYFSRYPKIRSFIENCKKNSRETGKAVTLTGRERAISEIDSKNPPLRAAAERLAVNTPLQGSAADIIKMAMLAVDRAMKQECYRGFMILQVHDELIFEIPDKEIPRLTELVRHSMENVIQLKIPLVVDISIGKNWKEC